MAYRGLFIGIDRYRSDRIPWLSCAVRDATALHALFADTLGEGGELLLDEAATREAIESALRRLRDADADDVVVITYSGHGSESHELVAYDTAVDELEATGISLEWLTAAFASIPAKRLVFALDCCFSGGMGAKVLVAEGRQRELRSIAQVLDEMAGAGRVILTASAANEPAWENNRLGHGLLTYHLAEALVGAEGVAEGGKLRLLRVLEHVTRSVEEHSRELGQEQHPSIRGTFEGDVVWPVFTRGSTYTAAFPDWAAAAATVDVRSLEGFGFPEELLDTWGGAIPKLNDLQLAAINEYGVLAGRNVVVSALTSSGKTMVGELAALHGVLKHRRAIFLLPMRALVNDKYDQFTRLYGNFGIRTIRATGEISDDVPALFRGQYDICLMTNEKFAALALAMPHLIDQIGLVVVDEGQIIADWHRGVALEFLLTMLKVRGGTRTPQIILLSAVVGDANGLDTWLDGTLLRRTERPVPLDEGVLRSSGDYRYLDPDGDEQVDERYVSPSFASSSQAYIIPLVRRLVDDGQQVIVFRATRGEALGTARYLSHELGLPAAQEALDRLPTGDPTNATTELRDALNGGVGFHTAELDRDERRVLEEEFRRKDTTLRALAATTTLAMGINTPASAVVIAGLDHPGRPPSPYTVAEYKNMVGRAGRLGFSEKGRSFVVPASGVDEFRAWDRYIRGTPEDIESRFPIDSGDPSSVITRVLASVQGVSGDGLTPEEVVEFIAKSFAAHQRRRADTGWALDTDRISAALASLQRAQLIAGSESGRLQLTPLGRLTGVTGTEVRSVMRLANLLRQIEPTFITDQVLVAATQVTVELDAQWIPVNTFSKHKEPGAWNSQLRREMIPTPVFAAMRSAVDDRQYIVRMKRAVACLWWMSDTALARIERGLMQFHKDRDAAGQIRQIVARTLDLLPTTIRVAEILHPDHDFGGRADMLMTRLELGLPAGAVPLGHILGASLSRAGYLALVGANLVDLQTFASSEAESVAKALGADAIRVEGLQLRVQAALDAASSEALDIPLYG